MNLESVCEFIVDAEHKTAPTQNEGFPSIRTPNIGRGRLILEGVNMVSRETYEKWTRRAVPMVDDLILAREAPVGNVAVILEGQEVCLGQRTVLLRPDKRKVAPSYLCYYLLGNEMQNLMNSLSGGSTVPHLNMKDIRNLELGDLPPLPTQRRIASILSAYDDLIENNLKRVKLLEEAAQNIYREWFVHFRFPRHERVRRGADGLPEGWRRVPLEDLALMVKRGVSPEYVTDGGFTVINQKCIRDNQIDLVHAKYSSIDKKLPDERFVRVFDVLVNSTGTGTLGRMAIVKAEMEDTFIDTHVTIVRPNPDQVAPLYLGYQLMQQKPVIENMGRGATNQIELSRSELSGLPTTVPPNELQWMFHNSIHPIIKQVAILTAQSGYAKEARDILLPRLMNRTIEV